VTVAAPATLRTNERPGTRAVLRHARMSATKARAVLDLIRGKDVRTADEILQFSERDAALAVRKLLGSAVANAEHNDEQAADELFVSACFADEGRTLRRYRPRARGRATRIRKRTCHITVIVGRMPEEMLERRRAKESARPGSRAARVAAQQAVEAGRRRRRRRGRAGEAAEVAEAEESEGIVDQQAPAVAAAEAAVEAEDDVVNEQGAGEIAEEEGIVDQQAAAVDSMDDTVEGVTEVEGVGGSPEAELAAEDGDDEDDDERGDA